MRTAASVARQPSSEGGSCARQTPGFECPPLRVVYGGCGMKRRLDRLIAGVVRQGGLEVTWSDGSVSHYGEAEGPPARLRFLQASAERALLRNPELALGEGYMDGSIDFPGDSLMEFLLLANANLEHIQRVPLVAALVKIRYACRRWIQDNS